MLAPAQVQLVQSLLAQGIHSQRKISKLTGVSRATVGQIADGRRPDYAERHRLKAELEEPLGPLARCPTCGGRVYLPCRLCRARKHLASRAHGARPRLMGSPLANRVPLPAFEVRKVS